MALTVHWGTHSIPIDLPPIDTPLAALRAALAHHTHLPPAAFKLIHAGAVMADDAAPISAYHLRPNSVIALVATHDTPTTQQQHSQYSVLATIRSELAAVHSSLLPSLDAFLNNPTRQKEHLRLGELLLQALLRLDAIVPEPTWDAARKERKDAVREVQAMLDRLDGARAASFIVN